jgi:uncharacterized protein YjbI with pentapeptide repeats
VPTIRFTHANLRDAQIRIDGIQIDFSGADLTGAKFTLTDLRGADLTDAKLDRAEFSKSVYDCATKWPANFSPAMAKLLPFPGPATCKHQLQLVYDGLALNDINFAGLDLRHASFRHSHPSAMGNSTRFVGADLSGADLRDADFRNTLLENTRLTNALYNDSTQWPEGFDPKKAGAKYCASGERRDCP